MHVSPFPHHVGALDVVVCHVHSSGVCHFSVDYHDLAVVSVEHVVYPRKAERVEFVDVDSPLAQFLEMSFLKRLVVGVVSESVEQRPYFHSLAGFLCEYVEEQRGYGVVAEVEVFQVYAASCLADGFEHVVEFLLSAHKQRHGVVVGEFHSMFPHLPCDKRVGGHGLRCRRHCGADHHEQGK